MQNDFSFHFCSSSFTNEAASPRQNSTKKPRYSTFLLPGMPRAYGIEKFHKNEPVWFSNYLAAARNPKGLFKVSNIGGARRYSAKTETIGDGRCTWGPAVENHTTAREWNFIIQEREPERIGGQPRCPFFPAKPLFARS